MGNAYSKISDFVKEYKELIEENASLTSISLAWGMYSSLPLSILMKIGDEAIDYYAEAHLYKWNAVIHTIGMPFTACGLIQLASGVLNLRRETAKQFSLAIYLLYGGHYALLFPTKPVIAYYALYSIPLYLAFKSYDKLCKSTLERRGNSNQMNTSLTTTITSSFSNWFNLHLIYNALTICIPSLICQEAIGHYFGGDIPSRSEGVLNAIVYAMYFSVSHLF
jgi:hypothetical protein